MENTRIKIKIGNHEFEAEGPSKIVQEQFEAFKQLIASAPQHVAPSPKIPTEAKAHGTPVDKETAKLDSICSVDGRLVSLTVKPESEANAALLIMLAQRIYRENETVTASELIDGLEQSGYTPDRLNRIMQPLADEGSVVRIGKKKGTRYRFTNQGLNKAQTVAKEEITKVS